MISDLYPKMPDWAQALACEVAGYKTRRVRYGKGWESIWRRVESVDALSDDALEDLRQERLRNHLQAAMRSTFWLQKFSEHGLDPKGKDPSAELSKLPVLSKAEVQASVDRICVETKLSSTIRLSTSGSTGSPLHFPTTRTAHQEQWAVWWRYRSWHGLERGDWHAHFGGKMIVPRGRQRPPYWRRVGAEQRWLYSAHHISDTTTREYIKAISRQNLRWLHGYPSALNSLVSFGELDELRNLGIDIVTTGSESLGELQRRNLEYRLGCTVRQHYGLAEGVANFSECELGTLHIDEDFAYVELIPVENHANHYHIVGTNYSNPAFPLFRYDTGDVAIVERTANCDCGRRGRVINAVDGRVEDVVVLEDGTRVGRLSLIFNPLNSIREAQIQQYRIGEIDILVARDDGYEANGVERDLLESAKRLLGNECAINIRYVDSVPRTASGKVRLVVSHLGDNPQ